MNEVFKTYTPEGFSTVNPYLFAEEPERLIDFLKEAFYGEELNRSLNPSTGEIANSIMKIGDTCFMISQARGQFSGMRTSFYLFVDDVDEMFNRAVEYGAMKELEPANMEYDDRQAGVMDPAGNYWWISTRLKETDYSD